MKKVFTDYSVNQIKKNHLELADKTHRWEQEVNKDKKWKFIDLFCGVGGIRRAFETLDAGCVFSSEIDLFAQQTYYANYGVVPYGDITKIEAKEVPEHDMLCAGFPCQPFSHIGKREGFEHPTQGTMFHEILRIIDLHKTKVLFLENVPGIVNHNGGNTLSTILNELKKRGYDCHKTILNASDFGVPQKRKRFYLVAFLYKDINFEFPIPPMIQSNVGDFIETNVKGYTISEHLQKSYLFKKDDGKPVLIDQNTKGSIKTLVSTYHKIQRLTGTFVKDGETGIRLLTTSECKAIMGFPDDFIIPVSRTQMYRQMGNSVVVKVIEEIAKSISIALEESETNNVKSSDACVG